MNHDGLTRDYIVYIPMSYDGSKAVPLLFNFHGWTMSADDQMTWVADMRPIADTANFILVYPQGSLFNGNTHWNVGGRFAGSTADDIGFTEAMIDTLASTYNIDLSRIYSCGYSNGGEFSFELACKLSSRIAAIGAVAGTMTDYTYNACNPTHTIPVVNLHGTADDIVDYYGTYPDGIKSQDAMILYWTSFNNTDPSATVTNMPDINTRDGSTVIYYDYPDGDNCSSVKHYKVVNGGHDWPGNLGNMDIDASSIIWNFVSQFDLGGLIGCGISPNVEINQDEYEVSVFPNPISGILSIQMSSSENQYYEIYSTMGNRVRSGILNSDNTVIDMTGLSSNIFILKINGRTIKLMKL